MPEILRAPLMLFFRTLRWIIGLTLLALAAGFAFVFVLEFIRAPKFEALPIVKGIERAVAPPIAAFSSWFGWHWPAHRPNANFGPLILAAVALFVRSVIDGMILRVEFVVRTARPQESGRKKYEKESEAEILARYSRSVDSETQRAALLKRYREIEEALKSSSRKVCTFLAVDVVGSTQMKVGEEAPAIQATFQAYEEMVRNALVSHGVWKQTWTPDGVMACFLDRQLALGAAQQILDSLPEFNAKENQLKTQIQVRSGLNEGELTLFEDTPLEKAVHHVIDVAGHMQKHADPDALQLSAELYSALQNPPGFNATEREVDGYQTYQWSSSNVRSQAAAASAQS